MWICFLKKRLLCCEHYHSLEQLPGENVEPSSVDILKIPWHSPEQSAVVESAWADDFQRPHPISSSLWFCFYLHKAGLCFWCRSTFPIEFLPKTCSQPRKLCRWLCRWLCSGLARRLSHRLPSCLLFQPIKMLINMALTFSGEGSLQGECLLLVLILEKYSSLHRQASIMYLWYRSHHLQYIACLSLVFYFYLGKALHSA